MNDCLDIMNLLEKASSIGILSAILAYGFNCRFEYKKNKKAKQDSIRAALVSFETTRVALISKKNQFTDPYKQEVQTLDIIIATLKSCGHPQKDFEGKVVEIWRDPKNTSICLQRFPILDFNQSPYSGDLSFMGPYCITFKRTLAALEGINQQIEWRNEFLRHHMHEAEYNNNEGYKQIYLAIALNKSSANNLTKLVQGAIELNDMCVRHVIRYANRHFPRKQFIPPRLGNFEDLDEYEAMINKAVDESN